MSERRLAARELPALSDDELCRYARHIVLPEIGIDGQLRLKASRILLVGLGGLGSPAALYLAAAGVGHLGLVEFDTVEVSNLQRQVIHGTRGLGRPKLESAAERIRDLNPNVTVSLHPVRMGPGQALDLVSAHDIVVDATDSFAARYSISEACVAAGRPHVYASVSRFEGQASVFSPGEGPCYRCLYPEPPDEGGSATNTGSGILGVVPGLLGTIQATEAIKIATGIGEPLVGRLLLVDALSMQFRTMRLGRNQGCPACGAPTATDAGKA